jgi:hypothetical protein
LTRAELGERLQRANLPSAGNRLARAVMHAELEGVICSGPRRERQFTYALLAHRAPKAEQLKRDEALATLARRFFTSHGPATVRDFVWWSGLTTADAKRGLEMNRASREEVDGLTYWSVGHSARGAVRDQLVHLLPIYDEYLVAYRDRTAVPHRPSTISSEPSASVTFQHTLMIGGHVAGTWRITRSPRRTKLTVTALRSLKPPERRALDTAVHQYQTFMGVPVEFSLK